MEYVRVTFPGPRKVLLDGREFGPANQTLMVEEGHHLFALDGPADFEPESQEVLVQFTLSTIPMVIAFTRKAPAGPSGGST